MHSTRHWKLRVAIEGGAKRQGTLSKGLTYGRDFVIQGRIRAPRELRGKLIKVTLSPFGPKVRFGARMQIDDDSSPPQGDGSLEGRLLIEIKAWEGNLHLGLSSELTPLVYRFQGGLDYVRGFDLDCRVVAPKHLRGRLIRLRLSPFGPEMRFGPEELDEVGQLNLNPPEALKVDLMGTLFFPEAAMSAIATCLSTCWKYLHVWTFDERDDRAGVSAFSFSSSIHKNLEAWATSD